MTDLTTEPVEITNLVPGGDLTAERERELVDGLVAALPSLRMAELFALRRDMFREADLITVAADTGDGSVVGVLTSRWVTLPSGRELLHILTQFVGERHRHSHAFRRSWGGHFAGLLAGGRDFPRLLALKTYNPVAYCAMAAFTRVPGVAIYPNCRVADQDPGTARLAREVAETVAAGHPFDARTGVIHGAGVPADLYPELPRSSHEDVNSYFAAVARPGDRVLALLTVPTAEAGRTILGAFGLSAR